jgi:hypothetical protein
MSANGFLDACGFLAASSGTGSFAVSAAVTGYQTPASAGAVNGTIYSYRAESADKTQWEEGFGAYTVSGTTLARTTITSNSAGGTSAINFSAAPNVFITALSADLANASLLTSGTLPAARIAFAAKSDQEAASSSSLPVTPAVQQNHPSAIKAWVCFTVSGGTVTTQAQFNIASVTRNAAGDYTIAFTNAMADANYVVSGTANANSATNAQLVVNLYATASAGTGIDKTTAHVRVLVANGSSGTPVDMGQINILIVGNQ